MGEMARETSVSARRQRNLMVVNERAFFVHMTGEAQIVALSLELAVELSRHRVVAVHASQLALVHRMVGAHVELRPFFGVTGVAQFHRVFIYQERVVCRMS